MKKKLNATILSVSDTGAEYKQSIVLVHEESLGEMTLHLARLGKEAVEQRMATMKPITSPDIFWDVIENLDGARCQYLMMGALIDNEAIKAYNRRFYRDTPKDISRNP